jgi:integrase|tara:strand:+ start:165 stop:1115 length:951 start_codon:yes stop_codon:yes gene_type:complete
VSKLVKRGKRFYYRSGYNYFSLKTENRHRAEQIKKHLDNKYELERFGIFVPGSKNFYEAVNEWIRFTARDKSDSWWKFNLPRVERFKKFTGDVPLLSISTQKINEFIGIRKNEGKAPATIHGDFKALRQFFDWCISNSYMERNPVKTAIFPRLRTIRKRMPIDNDTLQDIFAEADEKDKIFWQVCYYTGLDSAEAGTLEKSFIKNDIIYKTRNKTQVPVPIPLHPKLLKLKDKIFNIYRTKQERDSSNKRFKKLCEKRGFYGVIKCLRHSFVSHLFDSGLAVSDIKVVAGHTSEKMTVHYTKAQIDTIRTALNSLN